MHQDKSGGKTFLFKGEIHLQVRNYEYVSSFGLKMVLKNECRANKID